MSALSPKADIDQHGRDVRFVPKADIARFTRSRHRRDLAARAELSGQVPWPWRD
jgi:hypothetical protein